MKVHMWLGALAIAGLLATPSFAQRDSSSSDQSNRSSKRDHSVSKSDRSSDEDKSSDRDQDSSNRADKHAGLGVTLAEDHQGAVWISFVAPGSPAHRAGLQPGDQLLKIDDERVRSAEEAVDDIRDKDPGSRIALQIRRDGRTQDLKAKLVSHETAFSQAREGMSGEENYAGKYRGRDYDQDRPGMRTGYEEQSPRNGFGQVNLAAQIQSLQQQVGQLRREMQQLRQQLGQTPRATYQSGYRGDSQRESQDANRSSRGAMSGGGSGGEQNSQDRNQ